MSLALDMMTIQSGNQLKQGKTPNTNPPICKNTIPQGFWAKSNTEKVELIPNQLAEVFTPHDNTPDPEVEREISTHTQPTEIIQVFTLQNSPSSSKSCLHTGHLCPNLSQPKCYRKCLMKANKLFCTFLMLYAEYSTGQHS
jgi:hypothetical protein